MSGFFLGSVMVLAVLLYYPATRLIWVLSVRRLQRKLGRELSEIEIQGQKNRARVIAAIVVLIFSYLFNLSTLGVTPRG